MITIEHALALLLLLAFPVWDLLETRALKASANPRRKVICYQRITVVLWISTIVAWIALRSTVFFVWPAVHESLWQKKIHGSFVWGLVIAWVAVHVVRSFQRRGTRLRDATVTALKRLDFFLPVTREERMWFAVVSVTAGVCEEVLYRGFLIRYFAHVPWHIGLAIALVVSSVCFGFAHTYQGIGGIIGTGLFGATMAIIFFITGSLWLPMAMHALLDLNVLLLLRRGDLPAEDGAGSKAQ
jgi:membrane protease YdiL (CAAX protease family)